MSANKPPTIKKAQMIRYSDNWTIEASRILGAHVYYMTNRQMARAFFNMNIFIDHVVADLVPDRIFQTYTQDAATKKLAESGDHNIPLSWLSFLLDGNFRKMLFIRYSTLFKSVYGTGPSLDGRFSYLDLRPRSKPKPESDVVFINRRVKFIDVWGNYDYDYLTNKIRFVTVQNSINAAGFPIQIEKPLFSFTDKNIKKKKVNAVPFVYWSENNRISENRTAAVCKILEHLGAFFLHMEGIQLARGYGIMPGGAAQAGAPGAVGGDQGDMEFPQQQEGGGYDSLDGYDDDDEDDGDE